MHKPITAWAIGWRTRRGRLILIPSSVRRTRHDAWAAFAKHWDIPPGIAPVAFLKARKYDAFRMTLEPIDG